jgi:predicted glycogen debranching enzyme
MNRSGPTHSPADLASRVLVDPQASRALHNGVGDLETPVLNRMPWSTVGSNNPHVLLEREWIVTNGLGGYAAGTVAGACTRRYHGLLIAALEVPLGRTMMFNYLGEELRTPAGESVRLAGEELPERTVNLPGEAFLQDFSLRMGLPVWHYEVQGFSLEKRILMLHGQNTVHIHYRLLAGSGSLRLRLRPEFHFRGHDDSVSGELPEPYRVQGWGDRFEVSTPAWPPLRMRLEAERAALVLDGGRTREVYYRMEAGRGYDACGALWSPGYFRADISAGEEVVLVASTENWEIMGAVPPKLALNSELDRRSRLLAQADPRARSGAGGELVLGADQFVIRPKTRAADAARSQATGDEIRTVIAGYYWFGDWGRDTMISLEGLTLATGRQVEAAWILRTFANYVRDGLIPNLFPEGQSQGLYHTADASLWFFHALDRYVQATGDRATLRYILPKLEEIIHSHFQGTRFGIGVDPADGLLRQGAQGYQLTWMDAKVDDWVVTPRRGKAVEICALWYNALRIYEGWLREEARDPGRADVIARHAEQTRDSFNRRFWYAEGDYLYDVIDGETGADSSLRPNQIFAMSLAHPVLDESRWKPVLDIVTQRLLTPAGLRSLAPGEPDYKPRYDGDLRSRDAAYHQGTVWGWLVGPFIDAWLRVNPGDRKTAREFLTGFMSHLGEACIGSISEVFDAEAPYTPRGCPAQAWSVAEVLRVWIKTADS